MVWVRETLVAIGVASVVGTLLIRRHHSQQVAREQSRLEAAQLMSEHVRQTSPPPIASSPAPPLVAPPQVPAQSPPRGAQGAQPAAPTPLSNARPAGATAVTPARTPSRAEVDESVERQEVMDVARSRARRKNRELAGEQARPAAGVLGDASNFTAPASREEEGEEGEGEEKAE